MISGGANPAVNIVPVLDNGPYVVFAPTNEAFAALPPAQLDALKADPAALSKLDYYHVFLGLLGPDDVKGQRPTQQGAEIKVTGKGGDIKVNDTAKVRLRRDPGQQCADLLDRHGAGPGARPGADHADGDVHDGHHDHHDDDHDPASANRDARRQTRRSADFYRRADAEGAISGRNSGVLRLCRFSTSMSDSQSR